MAVALAFHIIFAVVGIFIGHHMQPLVGALLAMPFSGGANPTPPGGP
jgi:hypothetical protein